MPTKHIPADSLLEIANEAAQETEKRDFFQVMHSVYVWCDNTIENAKKEECGGALDARELYPDFKPRSVKSYDTEYYSQ